MICSKESSGFEVTKWTDVKNGGGILKYRLLYFVILSRRSALKQRFKQTPSDSRCRRFVFSRKPTKSPPCKWAASPLRLDDESMCHHGDADEGWCHHDLTAVLSAGSMDAIRIHQPGRSVTFQPVGTLWRNAAAAVEPRPNKHNLFEKGKVRGKHPLGRLILFPQK